MRGGSTRRLSHRQAEKWDTRGVLLGEDLLAEPVDFRAVFGNSRPVEVEIGTGKATFLLARAEARPDLNFLGIEWAKAYCCYAADRVRRAGLPNVRMLHADAASFFRTALAPASIWRLHIYFPDPWPKRRHHRRRLIQLPFVRHATRSLRPGGQLILVTDHRPYFEHIRRVLSNAAELARIRVPRTSRQDGTLVGTNFEKKYIAQGRAFYAVARMRYTAKR